MEDGVYAMHTSGDCRRMQCFAYDAKHFGELIEKGKSMGKKSLRRAQWDKAINGDARMLVFLGKNYLGQQDSPENNDDNMPLPWDED